MSMKLTPGIHFINILLRFYTCQCSGTLLLFHKQYNAQFHHYTQIEVMYSQLSTSCASKISINLMAQNLLIESWYNLHLLSISSTFYDQLLCRYSCAKKFPSQTVTGEKLCNTLSYKKGGHKMLMKLTPDLWSLPNSCYCCWIAKRTQQQSSRPTSTRTSLNPFLMTHRRCRRMPRTRWSWTSFRWKNINWFYWACHRFGQA